MKKIIAAAIALFMVGLGAYSLWGGWQSTGRDQDPLNQIREVWPR